MRNKTGYSVRSDCNEQTECEKKTTDPIPAAYTDKMTVKNAGRGARFPFCADAQRIRLRSR